MRHGKRRAASLAGGLIHWCRQFDGALRFLEQMADSPSVHGNAWRISMNAYYREALAKLLEQHQYSRFRQFQERKERFQKLVSHCKAR